MNHIKILLLLLPAFLLFACNNTNEENKETQKAGLDFEKKADEPITPKVFHLERKAENCNNPEGNCTHVSVDFSYPENISAESHNTIHQFFEKEAVLSLRSYLDSSSLTSLKQLADNFVLAYEKFNSSIEDGFQDNPWYFEMKGEVNNQTDEWLSVALKEYSYTGGAHGNYQTIVRTFSTEDQHALTFDDLAISKAALAKKMEQALRSQYGLSPEEDLSAAGFWFEDNTFQLNDNYAIRNDSLIFIYNPYEISSYAAGIIQFGVPLNQLGEVL